jgi:site-specific DNA-methyltransferase (adenine-specific)
VKVHLIDFEELHIEEGRQRKDISAEAILELAGSITHNGLIHACVVRLDDENRTVLVAGERRVKAMEYIWNFGQSVRYGEYDIPAYKIPCNYLGEIDPIAAFEIELEENIRRKDISWQERAQAVARLAKLKSELEGEEPSPARLAETLGLSVSGGGGGTPAQDVRQDLILARHMADPDIAKAASRSDAFKILKRKEEVTQNAALGAAISTQTLANEHKLLKGNCLEILPTLPDASFDVILSDPPYGMEAQDFGDSGGTGGAVGGHFYDDTHDNWIRLMSGLAAAIDRLAKPQAHLYLFCDIDRFAALRDFIGASGVWKCFRTPLIWFNPGGSRAPWPQNGPQRKSQYILYAVRGSKPVISMLGDVLTHGSDSNLGHHAQKPVSLYNDLLRRSVRPGDSVLDPFCGTGTIFPAAHALKCKATAIEMDDMALGIAAARLKELK